MKRTLLIVDDERPLCQSVASLLTGPELEVLSAHDRASALSICSHHRVDVVVLDRQLPDGLGTDLCQPLLELNEQIKIIFITAYPTFDHAVEAIRQGAFDYLVKPFDLRHLEHVVRRALRTSELEQIALVERYRRSKQQQSARLIGARSGLEQVQRTIDRAALSDAPVLITGETGVGKNVVARALHFAGPRSEAAYITTNCAALPDNLIEAELFGHVKGAFTGAEGRRGLFEMADGGTLLLDEIGAMPLALQPKLLSVLEDRVVRRLGSESSRQVDVRLVAATNASLEEAVERGQFRQDLFFRLNVIPIQVPPLRERPADIAELCAHFVEGLAPGQRLEVSPAELSRLAAYPWPGNVRELRNLIERAIALQEGPDLRPSALTEVATTAPAGASERLTAGPAVRPLRELERDHIAYALGRLDGNLSRTARALGISLNTLKRKLERYDLRRPGRG